jgi:FPC/CPF motif-containing protein YcgG
MTAMKSEELIVKEYREFLDEKRFPCIGAKAALSRNHIQCIVLTHMACPAQDAEALQFIYNFVDGYRTSKDMYHSAALIFKGPMNISEDTFDRLFWQRLVSLSSLDKRNFHHDTRVDSDPASDRFSFSLKGEAFFIVGLHAASSRRARQFKYPAVIFNPHAEFEKLRAANRFIKMRDVVRKRDVAYSGSVNPMLTDFNTASEVYQYSGKQYTSDWICPLSK